MACGEGPESEDVGRMIANAIARDNVGAVRVALRALGLVVAQVDRDLRYVWIDNPHPDFDSRLVVGKRDDELIAPEDAAGIMALKREVMASGVATTRTLDFHRSDRIYRYNISAVPLTDESGSVIGVITAAVDVTPAPGQAQRSSIHTGA